MKIQEFFRSISDRLGESANVEKIYGEPVSVEGKTIIPVAKISYGFGGGFGTSGEPEEAGGGGGGGGVSASPVGIIEITAEEDTRFIPFENKKKLVVAAVLGFFAGVIVAKRISKNKKHQKEETK